MQSLDDRPEIEYIAGVGYPKVSPRRKHSLVQTAFVALVNRCAGERGTAGTEWRFYLDPGTTFVPDVAYVSNNRIRDLGEEEIEAPHFSPDIAIEVRSPSDRQPFIDLKTRQYLEHETQLVINADPQTRTYTAHFADGSVKTYRAGDRFQCAALPWLAFDVAEAFALIDIPPV